MRTLNRFRWLTVGFLVLLMLSVACTPVTIETGASDTGDVAEQPDEIELGLGFVPNIQFAPFYVGMNKGFYADEGIDLSLSYGFENDYLTLVGTGETQFMVGSGDQVVIGRAQGLPVTYVMNWYARYPVVLFAKAEAQIHSPEDLAGKVIGIPGPFGANYVAYRGILKAGGLTEADVQTESIGFAQAAAVSEGSVDAAVDYGVNGPIVLAQQGISITQISLDSHLRIPANGLITNQATLESNPDLVRRMVRATVRSIAYTLENPDEAFAIALEAVPEAGGENEQTSRAVFNAVLAYWQPDAGATLGATDIADWETAAAFLLEIGLVDRQVDPSTLFSNQYLPEK